MKQICFFIYQKRVSIQIAISICVLRLCPSSVGAMDHESQEGKSEYFRWGCNYIIINLYCGACIFIFEQHKKYELTYQYYNDILIWHNQVVEVLTSLMRNQPSNELKKQLLSKLSALIESGRFYFPNIDRKDGFGKQKPIAYQGYRNVGLDFLVYEYQLFEKEDYAKY